MSVDSVLTRWASFDEAELARRWAWRNAAMDVRNALYWAMVEAQDFLMQATVGPPPESRRILALAQRAFGDLRGLVSGLPDDLVDRAPRPGEWTVRQILGHVENVERRYAIQTAYALERSDADPVRVAADRLPPLEATDAGGDAGALLARVADARAETDRRLGSVPSTGMTRPTQWVHYDVDVRFRLHRFGAHIAEHTIQCEKTLAALGWRETEGRRIVRQLWSLIGELEGLGATAQVAALARVIDERATACGP
jgi:hypothetical protein